jgi:hypothetical protein
MRDFLVEKLPLLWGLLVFLGGGAFVSGLMLNSYNASTAREEAHLEVRRQIAEERELPLENVRVRRYGSWCDPFVEMEIGSPESYAVGTREIHFFLECSEEVFPSWPWNTTDLRSCQKIVPMSEYSKRESCDEERCRLTEERCGPGQS